MLLSIPLPEVLRVIAFKNDKNGVFPTYIIKMNLNKEQPRVSWSKIHFDEIRRSVRVNPNLPMQDLDPNDWMDTDEDNDVESTNSRKRMDIIN